MVGAKEPHLALSQISKFCSPSKFCSWASQVPCRGLNGHVWLREPIEKAVTRQKGKKKRHITNISDCPQRSKIRWEIRFLYTVHHCHGLKGPGVCSRPYEGAPSICTQYPCSKHSSSSSSPLLLMGVMPQKQLQGKCLSLIWWQCWTWKNAILSHRKGQTNNLHLLLLQQKQQLRKVEEGHKDEELLRICACLCLDTHLFAGDMAWALDLCCFSTGVLFINLPSKAPFINRLWSVNKPWGCFNKWFLT